MNEEALNKKTFDFLSIMTGAVVLVFISAAVWALVTKSIGWPEFLAAVGSPASMLLGYWVRGEK